MFINSKTFLGTKSPAADTPLVQFINQTAEISLHLAEAAQKFLVGTIAKMRLVTSRFEIPSLKLLCT